MAGTQVGEGKLYLCAIKDACSGRIVGHGIDKRMKSGLAVAVFKDAVARCGATNVTGCAVHSDKHSQGEFNPSSQHPD